MPPEEWAVTLAKAPRPAEHVVTVQDGLVRIRSERFLAGRVVERGRIGATIGIGVNRGVADNPVGGRFVAHRRVARARDVSIVSLGVEHQRPVTAAGEVARHLVKAATPQEDPIALHHGPVQVAVVVIVAARIVELGRVVTRTGIGERLGKALGGRLTVALGDDGRFGAGHHLVIAGRVEHVGHVARLARGEDLVGCKIDRGVSMRSVKQDDSIFVGEQSIIAGRIVGGGRVVAASRRAAGAFKADRRGDVRIAGHHDPLGERLVRVIAS